MAQNILQKIALETKLVCLTGSSSAKGICHRPGVGRANIVASLVASAMMAQGRENQKPVDSAMFVLYMLVLHILAMVGFWSIMSSGSRRLSRKRTARQRPRRSKRQTCSEVSLLRVAPRKQLVRRIKYVSTFSAAKTAGAPSSSSTVVAASAPQALR